MNASFAAASTECVAGDALLRSWWVEPLVATMSFAIAINGFRMLEAKDTRTVASDIFDLRRSTRLLKAGTGYWLGIWLLRHVLPRATIDWSCPGAGAAMDLVFGVLAYDFAFYWLHRAMHSFPKFNALASHSTHHAPARKLRAHHVLEHSLVDGSLQVLTNVFVQRWGVFGPKNFAARILHNVLVTYLLTESHADLDEHSRWQGVASWFPRIFKGVVRHRAHHEHAGPPYQQFFGYLDDIFTPPRRISKHAS
ncbi:hypothetical protein CTAYLR_002095 [Chrysophaeum taylorii]|uniref:Fatty acid hydroxylase domain-containing protein n=1 Tax=Chrysophaeum taylorii TaxID=2483200 RepID=A0AAD7XRC3_9STRA|nr:hypothetical protein CTAYLR_002095 [Chrysophaeum taylorii]